MKHHTPLLPYPDLTLPADFWRPIYTNRTCDFTTYDGFHCHNRPTWRHTPDNQSYCNKHAMQVHNLNLILTAAPPPATQAPGGQP
jgi:hypothetical protein